MQETPPYWKAWGFNLPAVVAGLWYTGSMGPTQPDACPLCPATMQTPNKADPTNWCCQGNNFGTNPGYGYGEGSSVGMSGRHRNSITFASVRDGLSNTLMLGEALPRQCIFIALFAPNFNVSFTNVPINTPNASTDPTGVTWWISVLQEHAPWRSQFCFGRRQRHLFERDKRF